MAAGALYTHTHTHVMINIASGMIMLIRQYREKVDSMVTEARRKVGNEGAMRVQCEQLMAE